ncbi:MAG: hypothetical protein ABL871_12505 [Terricaulis sp.]
MTTAISIIAGVVVGLALLGFAAAWAFGVFCWFAGVVAGFRGQPRHQYRMRFLLAWVVGVGCWLLAALAILVGGKFGGWNITWH